MIQHIIDNIFLGDWQDAKNHSNEFVDIFTVAKDCPFIGNHFYPLVDGPYPENGRLLANAINDLLEIREDDWRFNKMILVHCSCGFSRSVAVVAGYMIRIGCTNTVEDALYYIKKIRPLANPVPELVKLLERY
jgi:protein-tyrosine phosphatase